MLATLLVVAQLQAPIPNGIELNTSTEAVQQTLSVDVIQPTSNPQNAVTANVVQPAANVEVLQRTYNPQQ